MMVLFGTQDGVYRAEAGEFEDAERVLDSGVTLTIQHVEGHGVYAASKTGLYHSADAGSTWNRLETPEREVYSVAVSPDGSRLYAGTHPAHLFISRDGGRTWTRSTGFRDLPSRPRWHTPRHRDSSHVRSLGVHPDAPGLVVAGVEVGGVHVSEDYGTTWRERREDLRFERADELQFDVHHVHLVDPETYVISCGGGLYFTTDAGRTWSPLAVDPARSYFQEALSHQGTLYAAAQTHPPWLPMAPEDAPTDVEAAMFESPDGGNEFRRVPYPGGPDEFVYAWAVSDGQVIAGTTGGRVIGSDRKQWSTLGFVPNWIRSMTTV